MPQANEYMAKKEELEAYQLKLVPGTGITINPTTNVISATGGSGGSTVSYTNVWEYNTNPIIGTLDIDNVDNYIRIPQLIPGTNMQITQDSTTGAFTFNATGGGNVDDVQVDGTSVVTNKIAEISTMSGATSQADGAGGLVPAPETTDLGKFLSASGDWEAAAAAEELTKAQYDALPSSKESDDVLYMLKDISTLAGTYSEKTQAEYNALPASKNSDDIFYYITDSHIIMHNGVQYGGTGGTNVEANPSGTPTDTLNTIEIGTTIYDIAGSGGSSQGVAASLARYTGTVTCAKAENGTSISLAVTIAGSSVFTDTITCSIYGEFNQITDTFSYLGKPFNISYYGIHTEGLGTPFLFVTISGTDVTEVVNGSCSYATNGGNSSYELPSTSCSFLTLWINDGGLAPEIYSTTERQVGVWKDEKPLYQKTIEVTSSFSSTQTYTDSDLAGADTVIIYDGYYVASTSSGEYRLPLNYSESGYDAYTGYRTYNHSLYMRCNGFTSTKCVITVQYTKTADVTGSSIYNTLGDLNVHYTTTEQVIGTYFGKPLYQKSFDGLNVDVNNGSWYNIANIPNGKDLIDIKMWGEFDEYYMLIPCQAHIDSTNNGLLEVLFSGLNTTRTVKRLAVQYTKTTD